MLGDGYDVGDGKMATQIKTTVDDPGDERENDIDFWVQEDNGELYYYGYYEYKSGSEDYPRIADDQYIVFSDPILFGTDGMNVGDEIKDSGSGTVDIKISQFLPAVTVEFSIDSTVTYTDILPERTTPMGTFTDALRVLVNMDLVTEYGTFNFQNNTFILKEGVGMVVQDQEPDANDAEIQAIDAGQVGGVAIEPDIPPDS